MVTRLSRLFAALVFALLSTQPALAVSGFADSWSELLLEHSVRAHSRTTPIRIRFQEDVATAQQVGQSAKKLVSLTSNTKWTSEYATPREVLITPEQAWQSGEEFSVTLNAKALPETHQSLEDYSFDVRVIKQTYNISLNGLTINNNDNNVVDFDGRLKLSDKDTDERIASTIKATLNGQPIQLDWEHGGAGRNHTFGVYDITKADQEQTLSLTWDMSPIGVDEQGSREIIIPEKNHFGIASIHQFRTGYPVIQVTFTNKLASGQNLAGLVQMNGRDMKPKVEDNKLTINLSTQFKGRAEISIAAGIEDEFGKVLKNPASKTFTISREKPQVKFQGSGVILPDNDYLTIPFEAVNVHSVQVTAFEVFDHNIGQFLQSNSLSTAEDLRRVGRYMWRKTIQLPDAKADEWQSYALDATELFEKSPGSLFRLTLSINRGNAMIGCTPEQSAKPVVPEGALKNYEDDYTAEDSYWDFAEDYFNVRGNIGDTSNPCNDGYYHWNNNAKATKNFMASNIGLIAKGDSSRHYHVIATDIASSKPLNGTQVTFYNFQNQPIAEATTDANGFVSAKLSSTPFYLLANYGNEQGVLRLEENASLPVSHFDVGGQAIKDGLKGVIFGERGVWRPGDTMHLTFVLADESGDLPKDHPVTLRLYDPRNQLVETKTNNDPVGRFYRFDFTTEEEAPTGNWEVRAQVGGASFSKKLKVETVQPNRLKVELSFGEEEEPILYANEPIEGNLFSQWLHGATAGNLSADVAVTLAPQFYNFNRGADFVFHDPTQQYRGRKQYLVDDKLDAEGNLKFSAEISRPSYAPGMMRANFTSKVYEATGQFSIATQSELFSPFKNYVGIKLPKGDVTRGMLLTDMDHTVDIVSLDAEGNPVPLSDVSVSLHKIHWRWWWEKGSDNLGRYSRTRYNEGMEYDVIETDENGLGSWKFNIAFPTWGRFLVRACDLEGGHCASKVVYIDWPGWAGRAQESKGVGASALTLTSDKPEYTVGDTAFVSLPNAQAGRALVSIENGSEVLSQYWYELSEDKEPLEIPITANMAPNVYAHVTMIQPHNGKDNDRPIRMYGIVPLLIEDPQTRLAPVIDVPEVWGSEKTAEIKISETDGKPMTYTVMVVDEGLLGLTRFRTPDLHKTFYAKEALGITTWDMFDDVVGAYGGELERLLALGGGDADDDENAETKKKRFPPVVKVLGPFQLPANATNTHSFEMPQYLGQVRVMVVANEAAAYGHADEQVFVREPLNLLPTLPRAVSPGESVVVPTLLFRNDQSIQDADLTVEIIEGDLSVTGEPTMTIGFDDSNEQIALFNVSVGSELGFATLKFTARSEAFEISQTVNIPIVSATTPTTQIINQKIDGGSVWEADLKPHGLPGTNVVSLTLSGALPFNLDHRLKYLIRYPHGCIEQTTSAAFPQLYLDDIASLSKEEREKTERNIESALKRLQKFQTSSGGLAYWPGQSNASDWGSNYAGHFMIEAIAAGYSVPDELYSSWLDYQREQANSWTASNSNRTQMSQAYRLYTLVLANEADLAAMNRLRVLPELGFTASQILAEAYHRYGLIDAAKSIDTSLPKDFTEEGDRYTYGSSVRNQAIALRSASVRGDDDQAEELAESIGELMGRDRWYSTQTIAYTLLAFSEYLQGGGLGVDALVELEGSDEFFVKSEKPVVTQVLSQMGDDEQMLLVANENTRPIYASVTLEGLPKPGSEVAVANKMSLYLKWLNEDGTSIDSIQSLKQGSHVKLRVTVNNDTKREVDNLALTQVFPSGWEIENKRFEGAETTEVFDYQVIRDDRVLTYFGLKSGESRTFEVTLHATYAGVFFLPGVHVEAMYDNTYQAATVGQWVEVTR